MTPLRLLGISLVASLVLAGGVGCASGDRKEAASEPSTPVPTPTPRPPGSFEKLGEIVLVNSESGFVLIDVGLYVPPDREALKSFAPGVRPGDSGETAVLAVSGEKARPFIVADIVAGTPARGDIVYH